MEKLSLVEHFSIIPDPRLDRRKKHKLIDIIVLSMCAVISGCDSWTEIEEFAAIREEWFKKFLELPNGIPSHDTFGRVFSLIDPHAFLEAFVNWVTIVHEVKDGEIINIDGKGLRAVHEKKSPLGIVSAWASEAGVTLGQLKTGNAYGEKAAFRDLLDLLYVKGCIVTMDANGTTANIVNKVIEKEGDYVVALKNNQKGLFNQVKKYVADNEFEDTTVVEEKNKGRIEKRVCETMSFPRNIFESLNKKIRRKKSLDRPSDEWLKIESIIRLTSSRTVKGKKSEEVRYYLSSLPGNDSQKLLKCVRSHWSIENKLHHVLDTTFREDHCRARNKHAAENFSLIRRFALNIVKATKNPKKSVNISRKRASWSGEIMMEMVLGATSMGTPN